LKQGDYSMCVFCAAIPTAMALGVTAKNRQIQERKTAEAQGKVFTKRSIPAGKATTVVVVTLIAGSVLVHTKFPGFIG
jgi:hypothetical protein